MVTGGASASDEYVEITNAGAVPADLAGVELAYVTSSGSTVTRKATWSELTLLATGQHLLVANALGAYASTADATCSGGSRRRVVRSCSALSAAPRSTRLAGAMRRMRSSRAPRRRRRRRARASSGGPEDRRQRPRHERECRRLERAPGTDPTEPIGGPRANRDAGPVALTVSVGHAVAEPRPERHADPGCLAQPGPERHPSPPSATPTPEPSRPRDPDPGARAPTEPDAHPDARADPNPDTDSDARPTPTPTPTPAPTPTPTLTPEPSPSPSPTPTPIATISIAAARAAADGTSVTLEGVLSTPLGVLEAGRGGFLQDEAAGIAIYAASALEPIAAGSLIRVAGSIDDRYGQRTVRLDDPPIVLAAGPAPFPVDTTTGAALEPFEGRRIRVHGTVLDAATTLSDGPAVTVDDGSGSLRVIFAGIAGANVPARGSVVSVAGTLGQRDSSGVGTSGYRLFVSDPLDLVEEPAPSPSPTPTGEPAPSPSPSVAPTPTPSPMPTPTPTTPSPSSSPTATPTVTPSPTPTPTRAGRRRSAWPAPRRSGPRSMFEAASPPSPDAWGFPRSVSWPTRPAASSSGSPTALDRPAERFST